MVQHGICNLSVIPLRSDESDRSEIISQLLFGDRFEILKFTQQWSYIRSYHDHYLGWVDNKQFVKTKEVVDSSERFILGLQTSHEAVKLSTGEVLHLLAGSTISKLESNRFKIASEEYQLKSPDILSNQSDFETAVIDCAKFFLHAPYLWGGKTIFGIDCSGLTQIVFKMLGKKLFRDAFLQAGQGETLNFLQEAKAGDLAFFDDNEGRITHVGIMLNDHQIIHASGRVKIDLIDPQGIYSNDLKKHTHRLRIIKRIR